MTERRNASPSSALTLLMVGLAGPAVFLIACLASRHISELPSFCPFLNLTSLPCPSCGMTRALAALLHGDFAAAMQWHAFAPLFLVLALAAWLWALSRLTARSFFPALPLWCRHVWVTTLVIFLTYYLLRLAGYCPVPDGYFPAP
ncbi:MAG TPA: DUF2752 domain-containing protein [Lentisphaeria bacterium]|nr:DUF2752 domain-containing protein [Lentisphaeria bacterium]